MEDLSDLLYIMRWDDIDHKRPVQTSLFIELDAEQQAIVDLSACNPETGIQELIYGPNCPLPP